jgi:hypothetical protein
MHRQTVLLLILYRATSNHVNFVMGDFMFYRYSYLYYTRDSHPLFFVDFDKDQHLRASSEAWVL